MLEKLVELREEGIGGQRPLALVQVRHFKRRHDASAILSEDAVSRKKYHLVGWLRSFEDELQVRKMNPEDLGPVSRHLEDVLWIQRHIRVVLKDTRRVWKGCVHYHVASYKTTNVFYYQMSEKHVAEGGDRTPHAARSFLMSAQLNNFDFDVNFRKSAGCGEPQCR